MQRLQLLLHLESDATFGRGEGVAGLVDEEVEYDLATGLPFIRGRTLKGLLVEECANLLFALEIANSSALPTLKEAAERLFGRPGSDMESAARVHFGPALLPRPLREAVRTEIVHDHLTPAAVLEALTTIRRQTAMNEEIGAAEAGSLRSMRVVLRETSFRAWLDFATPPGDDDLALVAACAFSVRRGGVGRNRGRGRLRVRLLNEEGTDITLHPHFEYFKQLIGKGQA
jgi:CRISPR/Cas system CSM-associated protein Csm3 (group 7 of RAMP superfamily)